MASKPASDKQIAFIAKLVESRNLDVPLYQEASYVHNPNANYTIGQFFFEEHGHSFKTGKWDMRDAKHAIDTLLSAPFKDIPESEQTGHFVGEAGKRSSFNVTVQSVKLIESFYGNSNLVTMTTNEPKSAVIVWFDRNMSNLDIGTEMVVTGMVKSHKTFKGERQTTLNRVKYEVLSGSEA